MKPSESVTIRPMTHDDVPTAYLSDSIALAEGTSEEGRINERPAAEVRQRHARYHHLIDHDPGGAWVAVADGRPVGTALALRREGVWGLSLLAVDAHFRSRGVARELLRHALRYADGCRGGIIASSNHPGAMRRYARAGFRLLPTLTATGTVRRASLPAGLKVGEGDTGDLDLAADVDRRVRGAAHGPDLEFMLEHDARLLVADGAAGRGYAVERLGSPRLLAATDPGVAAGLLRACLAEAPEGPGHEVSVRWISAAQSAWAVPVVLEAGLALSPAGPLCVRGALGAMAPYLHSGPFL